MNRVGAFLLAPVPAALFGGAVSWASGGWPRPVSLILFYLLMLWAAMLLVGLAIRALLLRAGKGGAIGFTLGGALMIALPAVPYILSAVARHPGQRDSAPVVLGLWIAMGALTGLTAWLLSRERPKVSRP
ncbi:MAG TPA: hypothetical protein VF552_06025, partial [Allosphingosinicella sp.]